jgi:hypothetical protein
MAGSALLVERSRDENPPPPRVEYRCHKCGKVLASGDIVRGVLIRKCDRCRAYRCFRIT